MRPRVKLMREFRDHYLLTNAAGNAFVKLYYNYSPPIANFVAKHDTVRIIIRWGLLPLAAVSWSALKLGLATILVLVLLICAGLISLAGVGRRKLLKKRS